MEQQIESVINYSEQKNEQKEGQQKKKGCKHYQRNCSIIAPCCGLEYPCRLCHDKEFTFNSGCQVETMNRKALQKIKCSQCNCIQDVSNECVQCHIQFAKYFCPVCKLWEDNEKKSIFHCDKCGICRVGKQDEVIHCDKCNFCYFQNAFDNHECKETLQEEECCICYQGFHQSWDSVCPFGKCGHYLHRNCMNKYLKTNINCPLCGQSYVKESEEQIQQIDQMVEQSKQLFLDAPSFNIWCHNCRKETKDVKFNYYGMKCGECGSYNTKMVQYFLIYSI